VMPHFQGQAQPTLDAAARASEAREGLAQSQNQAVEHMTKKYVTERDAAANPSDQQKHP
jgi:limonene 1,2-monooxygenase